MECKKLQVNIGKSKIHFSVNMKSERSNQVSMSALSNSRRRKMGEKYSDRTYYSKIIT